jgi:hypothetical protein
MTPVIIAKNFRGTGFGLSRTERAAPAGLGPVTYLAVHPG